MNTYFIVLLHYVFTVCWPVYCWNVILRRVPGMPSSVLCSWCAGRQPGQHRQHIVKLGLEFCFTFHATNCINTDLNFSN